MEKELLENIIGRYGNNGGSGGGLRSIIELHELITKPPFTGNGFQIRTGGTKSRVDIISLDAPNAPNIRAPTVNVANDDLSVLVYLLFMF